MKTRVKYKSGLMLKLIAAIVLLASVGAFWLYRLDLQPVSSTGQAQEFIIASGERPTTIATRLKAAGLIRSRDSFITYLNLHGLRAEIKAGSYSLAPSDSAVKIADIITGGKNLANRLVIPEGYRLSQIEDLAASHGIAKTDFEVAVRVPHSQAFLSGRPAGVDLEGYLFPDSYAVDGQTTATVLVNAMLDDFGRRVGPEYTTAFAAEGLTFHQGLTLASIVEREVNKPADRPIVAQIFLKRFHTGMPLGSDVTTQYASDLAGVPFNLNLDSPYNTRKNVGLPPGPICSPGLGSLDAVAHPAATNYLYFLAGSDGVTYYATTLAEHNINVAKHLK